MCLLVQMILWCLIFFTTRLGQGLGSWNVSVSVSSRTKCPTSRSRLGLGPLRLGSRLGLGLKGLMHIPALNIRDGGVQLEAQLTPKATATAAAAAAAAGITTTTKF